MSQTMNAVPQPPSLPVPPQQRCGLALASLILGLAGIVLCLGPLAGIPGVICGHLAQSKIRRSGGTLTGGGLAVAGLVTGYIAITMIAVMGLLASIAIPNFVKARAAAQKATCVMNLRAIEGAKATWALENKKRSDDVPTDEDLFGVAKYIMEKPQCPAGGFYSINRMASKPTCTVPGHSY